MTYKIFETDSNTEKTRAICPSIEKGYTRYHKLPDKKTSIVKLLW